MNATEASSCLFAELKSYNWLDTVGVVTNLNDVGCPSMLGVFIKSYTELKEVRQVIARLLDDKEKYNGYHVIFRYNVFPPQCVS